MTTTTEEKTLEQARAEYDQELSLITEAEQLSGRHLNCILKWHATELNENNQEYEQVPYEATIVAVRHFTGMGLLGPVRYVEVTGCFECVRQNGADRCVDEVLPLLHSTQQVTVTRNTDEVQR